MKKSDIYPKIKKVYFRFTWIQCRKCKEEFKKEFMWKVEDKDHSVRYYCQECFPTEADLEKYLKLPSLLDARIEEPLFNRAGTIGINISPKSKRPTLPGETTRPKFKDDLEFYRQPDE